ncbi:hypothetical protein ANANG_G00076920 [Anguilla anguilla]|uniref:SET domain-containing protein n=1 Tax=Anguilla anguilla TaxID=7936 RepID=A0A9D3RZT7_ANGAN|nr:hypothetical protein ANANG_G00076920 [Anguilla anguilla]
MSAANVTVNKYCRSASVENFEELKVYFSKTEWTNLQKCEKLRYKNIKRNHEAMLALGLYSPTPAFMRSGRPRRDKPVDFAEQSDSEDEEWRPGLLRKPASRSFSSQIRRPSQHGAPSGASQSSAVAQDRSGAALLPETQTESPASGLCHTQGVKNVTCPSNDGDNGFHGSPVEKQRGASKRSSRSSKQGNTGLLKKESLKLPTEQQRLYVRGDKLRSTRSVRYTEEEEPRDEDYLYCDECQSFFTDECQVRVSSIPGAGLGVFNQEQTVARGVHYGPYEGDLTDKDVAVDSGYSWMIYRSKRCVEYIDARRETHSNWMRYVNCARNEEEQNLVAFQYRGSILYRCFKPILPGQELLVWYGEDYAKDLDITFSYLWSNKCSSKGGEVVPSQFFPCTQCSLSYTAEHYLHKHIKRSHPEENTSKLTELLNQAHLSLSMGSGACDKC